MASREQKKSKEKKKPKADHNKKQKGAAPVGGPAKVTFAPAGKK